MDLKRLLIVIRRRLLWILQALVVIPAGTAYFLNQMPSVYQATAKLLIEPKDMQQSVLGDLSPAAQSAWVDELTILKTQTQIFNTKAFSDRVMSELQKANPDDRSLWSLGSLAGRMRANLIEDTRIIEVSCEDSDPVRAARIVNVGSEVFVEEAARHNRSNAEKARIFIEGQLKLTQKRLTDVENVASRFKEANGIYQLGRQLDTMVGRRDTVQDDFNKASAELRQLEAQGQAIRRRLTLSADEIREISRLANDPQLTALRNQQFDLQGRIRTLDRSSNDSQQVINLRRQIAQLEKVTAGQVTVVLGKKGNEALAKKIAVLDPLDQDLAKQLISAEIRAASLREQQLISAGAKAIVEQQLRGAPEKERQLAIYLRDIASLGENFRTLSVKLEELRIAEAGKVSPVSLIEPAAPNPTPIRPNKSRSLLSSVFVGLAVGVILAMLVDSLDETVWTKEELAYLFNGVPVLAEFPSLRLDSGGTDPLHWHQALELNDTDVQLLDVCRSLRTNLSFLTPATLTHQVLAVVAAGRDEVRTRILLSLAASYALTDKSICVVDVDLRHPALHLETGLGNEQGLSDVLLGHVPVGSVLRSTGWPNLSIITAGPPSLMPTELLERPSFKQTIASLREKFDIVMLHAPEADSIDALVIASSVDTLLLAVRLETDTRTALTALKERFAVTHLPLTGIVCWRLLRSRTAYVRRRDGA